MSGRKTFGSLPIGTLFEFDHTGLLCTSFAHGPWIKLSARRYRFADTPANLRYGAFRIGTIKAEVIQAAENGQRYVPCKRQPSPAPADGGRESHIVCGIKLDGGYGGWCHSPRGHNGPCAENQPATPRTIAGEGEGR